jgi:predicted  nucleic acid-binding Zn-ribbon protein
MMALEQVHRQELRELTNRWDNLTMPNFENEIALLEMELKKRQQLELDEFRQSIEQGANQITRVHYSNYVLDLEKRMQHLSASG